MWFHWFVVLFYAAEWPFCAEWAGPAQSFSLDTRYVGRLGACAIALTLRLQVCLRHRIAAPGIRRGGQSLRPVGGGPARCERRFCVCASSGAGSVGPGGVSHRRVRTKRVASSYLSPRRGTDAIRPALASLLCPASQSVVVSHINHTQRLVLVVVLRRDSEIL